METSLSSTRHSLILRLSDTQDVQAWDQFVSIYEPLVYRMARSKGFQDSDAREIVQEVLLTVARVVERWEPDPEKGRFRDWLFCIARNFMIGYLTRRKYQPLGTGDSATIKLLNDQPVPSDESLAEFNLEYRREVFRIAAEKVRDQVAANTWQAFWMTSIEGRSTTDVAQQLGMKDGAVHVARSRVRRRLRDLVQNLSHATGTLNFQQEQAGK